jgi:hypothetical protein
MAEVTSERLSTHHDLLGMPQAIDWSCVYPINTQVQGLLDSSNGLGILLRSPAKVPRATYRPGP